MNYLNKSIVFYQYNSRNENKINFIIERLDCLDWVREIRDTTSEYPSTPSPSIFLIHESDLVTFINDTDIDKSRILAKCYFTNSASKSSIEWHDSEEEIPFLYIEKIVEIFKRMGTVLIDVENQHEFNTYFRNESKRDCIKNVILDELSVYAVLNESITLHGILEKLHFDNDQLSSILSSERDKSCIDNLVKMTPSEALYWLGDRGYL